jgi:hypothetical protein
LIRMAVTGKFIGYMFGCGIRASESGQAGRS